ncbi:MAG TPA: OmpA family protein, partial [Polyangiaceae bacterium]|nr:OmpA family protein [Polyangiaceae bacterium]
WMIAGHTDNRPVTEAKYKNNRELSTARALNVTEYLIKSGMKPNTLVSAGYAEFDPVGNNGTPAGRQENRRIEIVLLPNIEELPRLLDKASAVAPTSPSASAAAKLSRRPGSGRPPGRRHRLPAKPGGLNGCVMHLSNATISPANLCRSARGPYALQSPHLGGRHGNGGRGVDVRRRA